MLPELLGVRALSVVTCLAWAMKEPSRNSFTVHRKQRYEVAVASDESGVGDLLLAVEERDVEAKQQVDLLLPEDS